MRILVAPDKFKGGLTAAQVCRAIAEGIRAVDPGIQIDSCPMSDGGDGFVDAMVRATKGTLRCARVTGPLPEMKVDATYGMLGEGNVIAASAGMKTAVIEMAAASGLALLKPEDANPEATTTFGTGELIVDAIRNGARRILLGIGGSATTDAGIGCAQACGLPVLLKDGEPTSPTEPLCGRDVERVVLVKHGRGSIVDGIQFIVACDVTNPLYGPDGAAYVYGPQKGATPAQVENLDRALHDLARRTDNETAALTSGAGAAGGLGFAMLAFFGATLRSGVQIVAEAVDLNARLSQADLVVSGEGRCDASSLQGKVVGRVLELARENQIRSAILCGDVDPHFDRATVGQLLALTDHYDRIEAMTHASQCLRQVAGRLVLRG